MSGTLGIIAQDSSRYTMFWVSVLQVLGNSPPNTRWDIGISTDIPGARNTLVQRSLDVGSEWILFVDDDHVFPDDLLKKLLAHDKDIVAAPYLRRAGNHLPLVYSHRREDGLYEPIDFTQLPGEGLLKVHAVGAGCLLIRSEVFRAISSDADWFEHGRIQGRDWNAAEDIIFCEKANEAGFEIFIDLGTPVGHMTSSAVWPSYIDKEWAIGFSVADGTRLYIPIETPTGPTPANSQEEVVASHG
jgi:hypothetical protein